MNRCKASPFVVRSFVRLLLCIAGLSGAACSGDSDVQTPGVDEDSALGKIRPVPGTVPPKFVFPTDAKTDDPSLNAFITEFGQICIQGEYDRYRLKVRRRSDPVSQADFEKVWHNIQEIRIDEVIELPDIGGRPAPRYAVLAKVRLQESHDEPEKLVVLQVLKELDAWVIDALPNEELNILIEATSSQPTTAPTTTRSVARTP